MPDATLEAFLDHGQVSEAVTRGVSESRQSMEALENAGVSMSDVTSRLLADGVKAFADSFDQLMGNIEEKLSNLMSAAKSSS
jgi:transaldolase